jgi:hypothetical protein
MKALPGVRFNLSATVLSSLKQTEGAFKRERVKEMSHFKRHTILIRRKLL